MLHGIRKRKSEDLAAYAYSWEGIAPATAAAIRRELARRGEVEVDGVVQRKAA